MTLEGEMAQVVLDLEMLSHGSTQSWNPSRSGDSDSKLLADGKMRVQDAPHVYWRVRFVDADTDAHRERALQGARDELRSWRGYGKQARKDLPSDSELLDADILEAKGWSCAEVALRCRCTVTRVRKVRLAAGQAPADGVRVTVIEVVDGHDRVRDLAAKGLSERQIEMLTRVPKTTIRRILKRPV